MLPLGHDVVGSINRQPTLTELLAPPALLPEGYEEVTYRDAKLSEYVDDFDPAVDEGPLTSSRAGSRTADGSQHYPWHYAKRVFALDGDIERALGRVKIQASLVCGTNIPQSELDAHHDHLLREVFGGREPTLEYYTDWYDTDIVEDTINGCRRTRHWQRAPQIEQWPDRPVRSEHPYSEHVAIIQSTDWGALKVFVSRYDVAEKWQTRRLARQLMATMQQAAYAAPTPTSEVDS